MKLFKKALSSLYFVLFLVTILQAHQATLKTPTQALAFGPSALKANSVAGPMTRQPSSATAPSASICAEALKKFIQEGSSVGKKLEKNFATNRGLKLLSPLNPLRDWLRHKLQILHGHPYPVMAIDESPRAYAWAQFVFGKLDDESKQLLEVEKITEELNASLARVRAFESDIQGFVEKATNLSIQKRIFEQELAKNNAIPFGIQFKYPALVRNDQGVLEEKVVESYFGNRVQFELELSKIRATLGSLQEGVNDRGYEQAVLIKKLETYRHEALRQQVALQNAPFPTEVNTIVEQITALYTSQGAEKFKKEFSPPNWIWQKLKWAQLSAELKTFIITDIPKIKDESKLSNLIKYITSLSDEEKRMLGLNNVQEKVEWYKRTKWVRLVSTVGGAASVAGVTGHEKAKELIKIFWNFVWEERREKEACAAKETPDAFADCVVTYLKEKFPKKIFAADHAIVDVLNEKGQIADPEIAKEVVDILARRNKFLFAENSKNTFAAPAKKALVLGDKSSPEYREHLIEIADEAAFKEQLLADNPKTGYMMFKYGLLYGRASIHVLVQSVVTAPSTDDRSTFLKALRALQKDNEKLKELADDLEEILQKHDEVIKTEKELKTADLAVDKTIDASIVKDPPVQLQTLPRQ